MDKQATLADIQKALIDEQIPLEITSKTWEIMEATLKTWKIIDLLSQGFTCKKIATKMGLTDRAVRYQLEYAKDLLGAKTLPHLVRIALELGIIK